MIYLDHNATAPVLPHVAEAMRPYYNERFGNPSSAHVAGQDAATAVDRARRSVAELLSADPQEIVFTASGTESVQTAMIGACRFRLEEGRHVVVSAIEHSAGLDAARWLAAAGWSVSWVNPEASGQMDADRVMEAVRDDTVMVSILHANNETGILQPVEAIGAACREREVLFHTDAIQSAGKIPVSTGHLNCDLVSVAAHKFGGPPGAAALWIRRGVRIEPLFPGSQEGGRRGGTQNTPAIVGMGVAAEWVSEHMASNAATVQTTRTGFERAVGDRIPEARLTGANLPRLPNTAHFTFGEAVGGDLVPALDMAGYAVSAGSACTSGSEDPSHVLLAMGYTPVEAKSALRVSVGPQTPAGAAEGFADALTRVLDDRRTRHAGTGSNK